MRPTDSTIAGHVERHERAEVEHLGLDTVVGKLRGGGERLDDAAPVRDERDVAAGALDVGLAEPDREPGIDRHHLPLALQADGLDEEARVVVEDRRR